MGSIDSLATRTESGNVLSDVITIVNVTGWR